MKGARTGHYGTQYMRNISCAGLSVVCILNKNTSSIWSWLEVGIQIFYSAVMPDPYLFLEMKLGLLVKDK